MPNPLGDSGAQRRSDLYAAGPNREYQQVTPHEPRMSPA